MVAAAGKSEVLVFAPDFGGGVDEQRAVIVGNRVAAETPVWMGRRAGWFRHDNASKVHLWAVLRREKSLIQPEERSVVVKVWR